MENKTIAIIATIVVIALVAAGAGYAYVASTTVSNNQLTQDYFDVTPLHGETPTYTGTTEKIKYDTIKSASSTTYGLSSLATEGQALTTIDHIKLTNSTASGKTLGSIVITMGVGSTVIGLIDDNDNTKYHLDQFRATLTDGSNTPISTMVNATKTSDSLVFTFNSFPEGFIKAISNSGTTYGLSIVVMGEQTSANVNPCVHAATLGTAQFNIGITAIASDTA